MPLRLVFFAETPAADGLMAPERALALARALLNYCAQAACVTEEALGAVPRRFTLHLFGPQPLPTGSSWPDRVDPGARLRLGVTWLCDPEALKLAEWARTLTHTPLQLADSLIRLLPAPVSCDPKRDHQGGTWIPYAALLRNASATLRQVTLKFCTPTLLIRNGQPYPLPDPALVFRAYLVLWNAFSDLPLSSDLGPAVDHDLELTDFKLRRRSFGIPPVGQAAFGGSATFSLRGRHPESVLKGLNALADFAEFCGTGAGTDVGMGLTRRVGKTTD